MDDSLPSSFLEDGSEEQELYGDLLDKTVESETAVEAEPSGEENPFGDSDDEEDEVQVTIGKIEPRSVQFNVKAGTGAASGKLDVDNTAMINDKPIYDFDLASMEDRPWRKPGADITDYFNYGFTEDSWNTYCERQKKLRTEYPTQSGVNKALFSNIHLANPLAMPTNMGGRHLVSLTDGGHGNANTGNVKVLTDNGGRFKVHSHTVHYQKLNSDSSEPIVRTVIGGGTAPPVSSQGNAVPINTSAPPPAVDFSRPPPGLTNLVAHIKTEPAMDGPPGVDGPPGDSHAIPTLGAPGVDMSMPPPGFNPSLPPPLRQPPMNLPPPGVPGVSINMPPPPFGGMIPPQFHQRFPPMGGPMGNRDFDLSRRESGDYDEGEDDRRRYRRRSRSRSPVKREATRRRDDDRRTGDRDRKDRERDRERSERSRRIRSRSASPERKRRDDREKRRGRDDDDDRRKRRYDRDDDDRRDRRERRRREEESPQPRDSDDLGPPGVDSAE